MRVGEVKRFVGDTAASREREEAAVMALSSSTFPNDTLLRRVSVAALSTLVSAMPQIFIIYPYSRVTLFTAARRSFANRSKPRKASFFYSRKA